MIVYRPTGLCMAIALLPGTWYQVMTYRIR